jgi:hypothetical protein
MMHEQIDRMVRRANPVSDPKTLEDTASVLIVDMDRRIEMQTDDRPTVAGRNNWRGALIGLAAATVILLGGLVYYLNRQATPEVAEPAPNAADLPGFRMEIDPGAYYTDADGAGPSTVRGTFVIEDDGWASLEAGAMYHYRSDAETYVALIVSRIDDVASPGCDDTEWVAAADTVEEVAGQFATLPGLAIRQAVAPIVAFGYEGYYMAARVPSDIEPDSGIGGSHPPCGDGYFQVWRGPVWQDRLYQAPNQMLEFWFLDVDGTPILVEASSFRTSSEQDLAALQSVLDTLVITP